MQVMSIHLSVSFCQPESGKTGICGEGKRMWPGLSWGSVGCSHEDGVVRGWVMGGKGCMRGNEMDSFCMGAEQVCGMRNIVIYMYQRHLWYQAMES